MMISFKRLISVVGTAWAFLLSVLATSTDTYADTRETLLIINSFNENDQWVDEITQPIVLHMATLPHIGCEMQNLNSAILTDATEYAQLADNIIKQYDDDHPEYVVLVGNLAFDMRSLIKEAWGDIPMLYITTDKDFSSADVIFNRTPDVVSFQLESHPKLQREREKYNFTAIVLPMYYNETVDMMVGLMPKLQEVVFLSDSTYYNRKTAFGVQNYIKEQYPNLKFSWVKANLENTDVFQSYMVQQRDDVGLLLSNWLYSKHSANGVRVPTSSELNLISASKTPVFSLRQSYIPLGAVGGVYGDIKLAIEREVQILDSMVAGKNMRNIPYYTSDESYPIVNYRRLNVYGMSESNCPKGTVFYGKPESFWSKYLWQMVAAILILTLLLFIMVKKYSHQRKTIAALNRNTEFVNAMPIPYSTATVKYDSEGNVVSIDYNVKNEAFTQIMHDNVIEGNRFLLFPPEFIMPKVAQLLKDHKMQTFIYHFPKTDTYYQFILCLVNTTLIKKHSNIRQIDIFAIDITNRHKMEAQLSSTQRKLAITLNVSNLIPWQYNLKTEEIIYDRYSRTDKFKERMDIENTEMRIKFDEFLKLLYPEDRPTLKQLRDDIRSGKVKNIDIRYRRLSADKTRDIEWCEMLGAITQLDTDGNPLMATGSIEYITQRIEQQQKMKEALERANESDRMKSTFLATMSHEIRTPLNAIVGFSNVIAYTQDEQERLEFCEIINKNNDQLLALINDVLDLAKIESNTVDINYNECDVNQMLDQIETSMAMKVPENIEFKSIKGSNDCIAMLDSTRVTQILTNLIANSIKFTSEGHITFGYEITDNDRLYFYVRDSGKGVSKEAQDRIFQRFVKLDSFVPGTGLGLSICKSLVDKMGGEIGVESAGEGKGSMFWFFIPYIPAKKAPEEVEEVGFFKSRVPGRFITGNNKKIKVLIAEDNESNYRLLAHLLDRFELVRAVDGHEAVDLFIKERPDVVLMDITMPEMDGYEAFNHIRRLNKKVPIIAVTANVYASDKTNILNHGFNGYVSKPITQKSIIDAIGHALTAEVGKSQES